MVPRYSKKSSDKINKIALGLVDNVIDTFEHDEKLNYMELVKQVNRALLTYFCVQMDSKGKNINDELKMVDLIVQETLMGYARNIRKFCDLTGEESNISKIQTTYDEQREYFRNNPSGSHLFADVDEEIFVKQLSVDILELLQQKLQPGWINMANIIRASSVAIFTMIVNNMLKGVEQDKSADIIKRSAMVIENVVTFWRLELKRIGLNPTNHDFLNELR